MPCCSPIKNKLLLIRLVILLKTYSSIAWSTPARWTSSSFSEKRSNLPWVGAYPNEDYEPAGLNKGLTDFKGYIFYCLIDKAKKIKKKLQLKSIRSQETHLPNTLQRWPAWKISERDSRKGNFIWYDPKSEGMGTNCF